MNKYKVQNKAGILSTTQQTATANTRLQNNVKKNLKKVKVN